MVGEEGSKEVARDNSIDKDRLVSMFCESKQKAESGGTSKAPMLEKKATVRSLLTVQRANNVSFVWMVRDTCFDSF